MTFTLVKTAKATANFYETMVFKSHNLEYHCSEGERVSSTRIRQTLASR